MPPQVVTPVALVDLSGGLNEGVDPASLQPNQFSVLTNFYPFGAKLVRRWGMNRLNTVEYAERITSLFPMKLNTGEWLLLGGAETGFVKLVGGVFATIPVGDGPAYSSDTLNPWRMRQRLDVVYAVRKATGSLKRITPDWMLAAGIDAPSVAPTLADGGAGKAEAGDYKGVVVFKNRATKVRSNPSPVSAVLTIGADGARAWSAIATSSNPQVDGRELYVSLPNNDGEYFLVDEIPDNITTTWTEGHSIDDFGDACSFSLGLPPPNVELIESWRERMWLSDGKSVFFSGVAQPEGYDELDIIDVYPDDGHRIRCLWADGSRLVVGKTNAMHLITSVGEGRFALSTLSDKHGIIAPDTIRGAEGFLFWYSGENVYRAVGSMVESISTIPVCKTLAAVPEAEKQYASAVIWPKLSWYVLSLGSPEGAGNRLILIYNYKTGSWCKVTHNTADEREPTYLAPQMLVETFDTEYEGHIYNTFYDGNAYEWNAEGALKDSGPYAEIMCEVSPKAHSRGGNRSGLEYVGLSCTDVAKTATVRLLAPDGSVAKFRDVDLSGSGWKEYSFRTWDLLTHVRLLWLYSGRAHVEIEGFSFGLSDSKRGPVRR